MNRPQKNKGGAGVKKRCTYCHKFGHDASGCDYMSKAAAQAHEETINAQGEYNFTPMSQSQRAKPRREKRRKGLH
eukprot:4350736-Pleurochrysis_carterae.AAC.1